MSENTAMPKPSSDTQVTPDPKLEKRRRRIFTRDYKLRIVQEADACKHGELNALLRREKLYSNQIQQCRREFAEGGVESLSKSAPGPAPALTTDQRKVLELEKKIKRLEYQLLLKDDCLELQKKALTMLDRQQDGASG